MKRQKKVAIIGHFGAGENILDGQTIKTRILFDELSKVTDWEIKKVDTYYRSKNPIKLVWSTFVYLVSVKDIFVLLSGNGMRVYFPLLFFVSKLFGVRVYHDVIGGNLDKYVEKYPVFKKYLNSFCVNWVETHGLKKKLEEKGIDNCEVIPNFKRLDILSEEELQCKTEELFCFCTFSRVMKEKGIEEAINAVQAINLKQGKKVCVLDVYGAVDAGYQERFEHIMSEVTSAVQYCGTVPYDKSVDMIKKYDALLFPTYWDGEGFPGTIIDAFSAGLPVIASDWNCNREIVEDGETGILYPNERIRNLEDAIYFLMKEKNLLQMKRKCLTSAHKFTAEYWIMHIVKKIESRW